MNVFDLFASLKIDTTEYSKGLDDAEKQSDKWGKGLEKAALIGIGAMETLGGAVVALNSTMSSYGEQVYDNAQRVGMSYKAYQQWDYIMKTAGSSMAENSIGFKTLTNSIDEARNGSESAQEKFKRLGISMTDVKNLSREDMFRLVVSSLQNVEDGTEKAAIANDLFGRSGMKLMPLLNMQSDELNSLFDDTEKYNMIMSDDMVEASDTYGDSLVKLQGIFRGSLMPIVEKTLPVMIEWVEKVGNKINEFTSDEENLKLVSDILGGALGFLKTSFDLLMGAVEKVVQWGLDFVKWLKEGSPEAETFKAVVIAIGGAFMGWLIIYEAIKIVGLLTTGIQLLTGALSFLAANPIMIVIGVIGALIAAFIYFWNTSETFRNFFLGMWEKIKEAVAPVIEMIVSKFQEAWAKIQETWEKVKPYFEMLWENLKDIFAVVAEYISGGFKVAWEYIKLVWDVVTGYFQAIWNTIAGIFSAVKAVLSGDWQGAWDAIKGIVDTWINYFQTIWGGIKNVFSAVGSWFKGVFEKAWIAVKGVFANWGSFFGGLWTTIKDKFSSIGTNISNAISGAVKGGINGVISAIEKTINKAIGLINGAIGLINKIPGANVSTIDTLSFPRLARGGILEKGQIGLLEGSGAEAVVPLENNAKWIQKVALDMSNALGGKGDFNQNITINSPKELSPYEVARQTRLATQNMILAIRS